MEKVTNTARILALLQKFKDHRGLLAVKLDDKKATFTTAIIDIDTEKNYLILDELKPDNGDQLLRKTPIIKARGQTDGVVISFIAKVDEFGVQDEIPFYKLSIPPVIGYQQRRQNVRIRVGAAQSLAAKITVAEDCSVKGFVEDLSLGGLRINFKKELPLAFQVGLQANCHFTVIAGKRETLDCKVIIRTVNNSAKTHPQIFIGAQFLELDRSIERQLQKMIMNLQRSLQQKRGD